MTFSIVARDAETGDLGVAVASKFLAVGSVVPHARAGVGAIATQAFANVRYGPEGLDLLAQGLPALEVVERLTAADEGAAHRQLGVVDARGGSATFSGAECMSWAGGRTGGQRRRAGQHPCQRGRGGRDVRDLHCGRAPFPELLLAALKAGDGQGGDRRGRESAALLVVRHGGGYGGANDRWIDLRVDDHHAPIDELGRLLDINHLLMDRPAVEDLLPIDEQLAGELQRRLATAGFSAVDVRAGRGSARRSVHRTSTSPASRARHRRAGRPGGKGPSRSGWALRTSRSGPPHAAGSTHACSSSCAGRRLLDRRAAPRTHLSRSLRRGRSRRPPAQLGHLRFAQDLAWIHSESAGFGREWYADRQLTWLVRGDRAGHP